MELKKIILFFILIFYFGPLNAELIKPSNKLDPYDVVKIQLKALKNNNYKISSIKKKESRKKERKNIFFIWNRC